MQTTFPQNGIEETYELSGAELCKTRQELYDYYKSIGDTLAVDSMERMYPEFRPALDLSKLSKYDVRRREAGL